MNELVFFGGRPVMHGRTRRPTTGVGDDVWPADLLAYRKQWQPFIDAHVALWRYLNSLFESTPAGKTCPTGTDSSGIDSLTPAMRGFCASLILTRQRIDQTDPARGIPAMWSVWDNKSAADVLAGAPSMLQWLQDVVKLVGGTYKDELLQIAETWGIDIKLPDVPSLTAQQAVIAQIEGAYVSARGVLELAGYATGTTLQWAATQAAAVTEGLTDTVKALPKVVGSSWTWVGIAAVVAVVGAGLVVYYVPGAPRERRNQP